MLIRKVAIGEKANLTVWRDGNQRQLQVTIQPARQIARQPMNDASHEASFGRSDSSDSDLASRTMRLEQQINSLTQELASLRQEMAQLRTTGPVQTGFNAEANQNAPPQAPQDRYKAPSAAPAAAPGTPGAAPPPGFGANEDKLTQPPADAAKPPVPPTDAAKPAAPPAPAAEKPKADDKGATDELFK
jgi:hypothetical protein